MFTFADQQRTQKDFAANIEKNQFKGMRNVSMTELINYAYNRFVHRCILDYEDSRLEEKYPEFKSLMKEYEDGILLYELSNEKVWKKAELDTTGLHKFYEQIKDDYQYPVRAHETIYTLTQARIPADPNEAMKSPKMSADKAYSLFKKMMDSGASLEEIDNKFSKKAKGWMISIRENMYAQHENRAFDTYCPWQVLLSSESKVVVEKADERQYITIEKVLPSPKPLNEIRGAVSTRYQNLLEEEWVKTLRRENPVWVDYERIFSLIR